MKETKIYEYNYTSPDGVDISIDNFSSEEKATMFLKKWISFFKKQGYYSTAKGNKIALEELQEHCKIAVYEFTHKIKSDE